MKESSFALNYEAGQESLQQGTARITMEFPEGLQPDQDRQAATRTCFEDLKHRRPDVSLSGSIDDKIFARCMDRAVGSPRLIDPDVDPQAQACYDAAQLRLPSANFDNLSKDLQFRDCLERIGRN